MPLAPHHEKIMSKQLASLIKAAVFDLGDAEEAGGQILITDLLHENGHVSPKIAIAQQTADGGLTFAILPVGTSIRYTATNLDTGAQIATVPALIPSPPVIWPPGGNPDAQLTTEVFLSGAEIGGRFLYVITEIDIPGATYRTTGPMEFALNTQPTATP